MRTFLSDPQIRTAGALALLTLAVPVGTQAQQLREVVSHEVAVARNEAALHLELDGDGSIHISFRDGVIRIGEEEIGSYEAGGALETSWRELLGRAVVLADGPLARALRDWAPPAGLPDDAAEAAGRIDRSLEEGLASGADAPAASPAPEAPTRSSGGPDVLASLLGRTDRLVELAGAMEGLRLDDVDVRIGQDVVVAQGEEISGSLVVIDGDLEVQGTVHGDVVLVGGTLRTFQGSRIGGDVRLSDGRLIRRGGEIEGEWTQVEDAVDSREMRDRLREEIRRELRDEIRTDLRGELRDARADADEGWSLTAPFRSFGRGLAALVGDLMKTVIMALVGGALVFFARRNLEVVADAARRAPARAAVVGLAGSFMILPVYVLGAIALAISIIGLPVLLAWLPLFPVAVGLAAAMGFYAVAANIGEWLAGRRYPGTDWIRSSNLYTLVVGGVVALMIPVLAADVVRMAGSWLGFLSGLLVVVGVLAGLATTVIGFGAVLLTRAGRRPEHHRSTDFFDDDWDFDSPSGPSTTGPTGTPGTAGGGPGPGGYGSAGTGGYGTGAGATAGTGADRGDDAPAEGTGRGTGSSPGTDSAATGGTGKRRASSPEDVMDAAEETDEAPGTPSGADADSDTDADGDDADAGDGDGATPDEKA